MRVVVPAGTSDGPNPAGGVGLLKCELNLGKSLF